MKVFLTLVVLAGLYALSLVKMSDLAIGQVVTIHQEYTHVSATSEQWADGDTSADLIGR